MNPKLLIFDLDGTLSDTQPLLHTMVYRALLDSGIDAGSPENVTKLLHKNGKHIFFGKLLFFDKMICCYGNTGKSML